MMLTLHEPGQFDDLFLTKTQTDRVLVALETAKASQKGLCVQFNQRADLTVHLETSEIAALSDRIGVALSPDSIPDLACAQAGHAK